MDKLSKSTTIDRIDIAVYSVAFLAVTIFTTFNDKGIYMLLGMTLSLITSLLKKTTGKE